MYCILPVNALRNCLRACALRDPRDFASFPGTPRAYRVMFIQVNPPGAPRSVGALSRVERMMARTQDLPRSFFVRQSFKTGLPF